MAELDYDALQRLVDAATPGPWANYSPNPKTTREQAIYSEWLETDPEARSSEIAALLTPKDAAFIAASRSAVPALLDRVRELEAERDALDAAFDRDLPWRYDEAIARANAAVAERDAATAAIERVRAVHVRDEYGLCVACSWEYPDASYDAISNDVAWPCPTIAALDGAPEPEVKP